MPQQEWPVSAANGRAAATETPEQGKKSEKFPPKWFDPEFDRLVAAFFPGRDKMYFLDTGTEYAREAVRIQGMDGPTLAAAVDAMKRHCGRWPLLKEFIDYCHDAVLAERRETQKALPPPEPEPDPEPLVVSASKPPPGYDRALWDRNVAIGKARARNQQAAYREYRESRGLHRHAMVPLSVGNTVREPDEAQIQAVLEEMRGRRDG